MQATLMENTITKTQLELVQNQEGKSVKRRSRILEFFDRMFPKRDLDWETFERIEAKKTPQSFRSRNFPY